MTIVDATFNSNGNAVPVRVFRPAAAVANGCGLVVAYGTEGVNAQFGDLIDKSFCEVVAESGFVVARPDYFQATGTAAGIDPVFEAIAAGKSPLWVQALVEAVAWLQNQSYGVAAGRVGLAGFSLGGNQALQAAAATPVKGVIDFFGPINALPGVVIPQSLLLSLPPVQIHHGKQDNFPKGVPYSESKQLHDLLQSNHRVVELHPHPGQGHPGQFDGSWTESTQAAANAKVIVFLNAHL